MKYWWRHLKRQPNRLVAGGFAAAILLAAILLALPVSASGERIPLIDGLFKNTSTSLGAGLSVTKFPTTRAARVIQRCVRMAPPPRMHRMVPEPRMPLPDKRMEAVPLTIPDSCC